MTTTRRYEQTIEEIHAVIDRLTEQVRQGTRSQRLLDTYVIAARTRSDWREK